MGASYGKEDPNKKSWAFGKEQFQHLVSQLDSLTSQKKESDRQIAILKMQTESLKKQNEHMLNELKVSV